MTDTVIPDKRTVWSSFAIVLGAAFIFGQLFYDRTFGVNLLLLVLVVLGGGAAVRLEAGVQYRTLSIGRSTFQITRT